MTQMIPTDAATKTMELLTQILVICKSGERAQFLCDPGLGESVVQRLRVTLSRSRKRNERKGRPTARFTFKHTIYRHTDLTGKRHDSVVVWTEKSPVHERMELLDDFMENRL